VSDHRGSGQFSPSQGAQTRQEVNRKDRHDTRKGFRSRQTIYSTAVKERSWRRLKQVEPLIFKLSSGARGGNQIQGIGRKEDLRKKIRDVEAVTPLVNIAE